MGCAVYACVGGWGVGGGGGVARKFVTRRPSVRVGARHDVGAQGPYTQACRASASACGAPGAGACRVTRRESCSLSQTLEQQPWVHAHTEVASKN